MGTPRDEEIRTLAKQLFIHWAGVGAPTHSGCIHSAETFVDALDKRQGELIAAREAAAIAKRNAANPVPAPEVRKDEHVPEPPKMVYGGEPVCERHPILFETECVDCANREAYRVAHQAPSANP